MKATFRAKKSARQAFVPGENLMESSETHSHYQRYKARRNIQDEHPARPVLFYMLCNFIRLQNVQ